MGTEVAAEPVPATRDDSSAEVEASPRSWSSIGQKALLALLALILLERAWDRRWMADDGFINLRVARMILDGHGPVFNAGERVEVTTSTLWVWLLVVGDVLLPLRMEWVAVVLGIGFAVGGLLGATLGAARLQRSLGVTGLLVPAGALVLCVLSPIWDFSTSGLEGGLTFGWIGLCAYLLGRWADTPDQADTPDGDGDGDARPAPPSIGTLSAVVLGLGPLVRPDLVLMSGVLVAGVLLAQWSTSSWTGRLKVVAAAGALPVGYQIFRMGYYASMVPNTALAKAAGRSRWGNGIDYLRDLVQPYWLVIPLVAVVVGVLVPSLARARGGPARRRVALLALPIAGLLDAIYVVGVGGDYMHGRLLLPALFAGVAPFAVAPWPIRSGTAAAAAADADKPAARAIVVRFALGATVVWALLCLAFLRPDESPVTSRLFSSDARQGTVRQFGEHPVTSIADLYRDQPWTHPEAGQVYFGPHALDVDPPDDLPTPAHAGWGIGVGGYLLGPDVYVIDMLGLGDVVASRFELHKAGNTGHEKPMPFPWLAARLSTGPVDPSQLPAAIMAYPLYESPAGQFDADAAAAREALKCGDLERLAEAVREPMSPGRFLENLVSAPGFTLLDVPADPNEAVERFCD